MNKEVLTILKDLSFQMYFMFQMHRKPNNLFCGDSVVGLIYECGLDADTWLTLKVTLLKIAHKEKSGYVFKWNPEYIWWLMTVCLGIIFEPRKSIFLLQVEILIRYLNVCKIVLSRYMRNPPMEEDQIHG